jgi:hypothetical protein
VAKKIEAKFFYSFANKNGIKNKFPADIIVLRNETNMSLQVTGKIFLEKIP